MAKGPIDRLYDNAKENAKKSLGGPEAYRIQSPVIRRMAVANAILVILAAQDDSTSGEALHALIDGLYDRLTGDTDFQP